MADSGHRHSSQYSQGSQARGVECSSILFESLRIPVRVRRPASTGEALCRSPMVEASRAHSSGVKRVPHAAAVTRPEMVFAWRPAAERASNAGAGGFEALILIGLAIQHYRRIVIGGCAHAPVIRAQKGVRTRRACPCGVDFECGAVVPVDHVAGAEVAAQHFGQHKSVER
jgi:hypothetical protein